MPVEVGGRTYYRTAEVCQIVGIGKSTLFRWIKNNIVQDAVYRDRKGWRLFTNDELHSLISEASIILKDQIVEIAEIPSAVK